MMVPSKNKPIRVLYTFPQKIGDSGVCYAAWHHVKGLRDAGAKVTVFPGVLHKSLPEDIRVRPTLSRGKMRLPYSILGNTGSYKLHDWIVARRLRRMAGEFDIVHGFALGSLETLHVAKQLGIPTVLERSNAHTRFAYEVVEKECEKLGVTMPQGHSHAFDPEVLRREEAEYDAADYLFCPSDFVARTFEERGFAPERLKRFQYGYDENLCYPSAEVNGGDAGLSVVFAAGCAPRKGLHYALDAWLKSTACRTGRFLVVGDFIPGYAERLAEQLSHPSVSLLGYRNDLVSIMRSSDVLILPSIEEGSALVTYDARGAGCVLLVSDSSGAVCEHEKNALIHRTGDVEALAGHFSRVHEDRVLLSRLRAASLETADQLTWSAAGRRMVEAYQGMVGGY